MRQPSFEIFKMQKHLIQVRVRYSETDQMGVVYHANYFSFFEQGRTGMLREFGIDYYEIEKKGFIFPVRDVGCTYLKSIRLGETIYCETQIIKLSKVRMDFQHEIYNDEGELKVRYRLQLFSLEC